MHGEMPLISTIVGGIVLAFILGLLAQRLRLPPLVGYLFAGILVGPYTLGFVADQDLAPELAELGVILLMFGVGLHFSLKDLLSVRAIALPGAVVQIGFATFLGWAMASFLGWPLGGSLVFGLALSVASTVVLLRALQERRLVETERGKIAVGWLIVEDLAMVLALVLIPAFASVGGDPAHADPLAVGLSNALGIELGIGSILAVTLLKVALFVAVMLVFGRRMIPWLLHYMAHTGSRELFRLGVLAIALGVAFGASTLFGVSLALGAFFAGMVLSESELSHSAAQESLPLRDAFAVLFFVSVGMLFSPGIIFEHPIAILATVFIIVIGKSLAAFLIVLLFGKGISTALTISASLAQVGEFSFILAELGVGLNLLPPEGRDFILAGAIISIILNPLVFYLSERMRPTLEARFSKKATESAESARQTLPAEGTALVDANGDKIRPTTLSRHCVIAGCGRVGGIVAANLKASNTAFLVVEDADLKVADLKAAGIEVIPGNASSTDVLDLTNLTEASSIVVAIPNAFEAGNVVSYAKKTNPRLLIVARAHSDAEVEHLTKLGADTVIMGEREIANGMLKRLDQILHADAGGEGTVAPRDQ
ncbi:YbaL family putative K(+) efflux transporter [Ciceribacter azotifigens]|uniref:YbaL family putative K(+) efflux transporter n=1 Tax=Ciceribacter azotifigens TaxID=2069303 RepID=UPI003A85F786